MNLLLNTSIWHPSRLGCFTLFKWKFRITDGNIYQGVSTRSLKSIWCVICFLTGLRICVQLRACGATLIVVIKKTILKGNKSQSAKYEKDFGFLSTQKHMQHYWKKIGRCDWWVVYGLVFLSIMEKYSLSSIILIV